MNVKITGSGSYIPDIIEKNEDFHQHEFLNLDGSSIYQSNQVIVEKFKAITGIGERRYVDNSLNCSDIAFYAAQRAIKDANTNPEELDYIIVAHNYGDVKHNVEQSDTVPSIASRVKHLLAIKNPKCVGYDILFGCPGWIEATIQANAFIKAGIAKKCLVIGAETLSRVIDKHDRDSMIYSDGAGAVVVEASNESGILAHESATYTLDEAHFIYFGETNNQDITDTRRYIKMYGRKIYEFALSNVPAAMKSCLEKSGIDIKDVDGIQGDFKLFVKNINRKEKAEINQEFFDRLFGKDIVKNEEEFDKKIDESISLNYNKESDYLLERDIRDYFVDKTKIATPNEFLKDWLLLTNSGKVTKEQIDSEFDLYLKDLRWSLIRNKVAEDNKLSVEQEDITEKTKVILAEQFGGPAILEQLGDKMDEFVKTYLEGSEGQNYNNVVNQVIADKVYDFVKENITITDKKVSLDDFRKKAEAK